MRAISLVTVGKYVMATAWTQGTIEYDREAAIRNTFTAVRMFGTRMFSEPSPYPEAKQMPLKEHLAGILALEGNRNTRIETRAD